ncbi:MAG TPA: ornithine cyclodeaminase family protein [Terriglobia bacterium]|jgi:ornithine cyclodeaminase/alanine dehydrogenase-like protein (mu-crystallin family)
MKALYLKEEEIENLVAVPEVIEVLDAAFRDQSAGRAWNNPRSRIRVPGGALHLMAGAIPGYFGYKAYTVGGGQAKFFFFLYSAQTMELLALMEADALGQKRTGAATGLATQVLSNADSTQATIFGAGWQAQTQLLALDAVRRMNQVFIVSKRPERRYEFIKKMQPQVKTQLVAARSAEDAVRSSQIVTTITNSRDPVLKGEWLQPGTHVNAAGGNTLIRREFDDETVLRSNRIVVDSLDQCKLEAGEFVTAIETGKRHWEDFAELRDVIAGSKPGRAAASDITIFKSGGIAMEDVAIGKLVYERAVERGIGRHLDM